MYILSELPTASPGAADPRQVSRAALGIAARLAAADPANATWQGDLSAITADPEAKRPGQEEKCS